MAQRRVGLRRVVVRHGDVRLVGDKGVERGFWSVGPGVIERSQTKYRGEDRVNMASGRRTMGGWVEGKGREKGPWSAGQARAQRPFPARLRWEGGGVQERSVPGRRTPAARLAAKG